ncbi:hypothetical protein ACFQV2_31300 [Actinokineospora soli]|uniref:STAS domain-containing protein n=1 Tax=Actinokineospora soli TaxID=1048753 RepID=A0ABW2TTT9_9PSEU
MSAVRFCGSRALVALVNGQREAKESGYDLVVVAPEHGVVENVLILTGLISSTTVRISLDHAFLAAR